MGAIPVGFSIDSTLLPVGPCGPQGLPGAVGATGPQGPAGSLSAPIGTVSLADYMNARYGVGLWSQRTGVGIGTDIGLALVDALTYLRATYGRGKVIIPPGSWLMNTAPTADQYSGHQIEGFGSQSSLVFWNSNTGSPFSFSGGGGYTGGGLKGIGIQLEAGYPTSTATAILMQGNATYQPDQMEFRDIYCSAQGASYWYNGFYANGCARTSPQGIRVCDISNAQMFRCANAGWYLSNAVQWTLNNVGVYVGAGSGNNFYLAGGGSPSTNSTQVYINGLACSNDLNITNCTRFDIKGGANTVSTSASATNGFLSVIKPGALIGAFGPNVTAFFN